MLETEEQGTVTSTTEFCRGESLFTSCLCSKSDPHSITFMSKNNVKMCCHGGYWSIFAFFVLSNMRNRKKNWYTAAHLMIPISQFSQSFFWSVHGSNHSFLNSFTQPLAVFLSENVKMAAIQRHVVEFPSRQITELCKRQKMSGLITELNQ